MAISWSDGLLAGAAGVGEYALEQQEKRDMRAERTRQLLENMKMERTKSQYAIKLKAYERNQDTVNKLKNIEAGSPEEQFFLYRQLGLTDRQAEVAAVKAINSGKLLKRPGSMDIPEFVGDVNGVAKNKHQSWARDFLGLSQQEPTDMFETVDPQTGQTVAQHQGQPIEQQPQTMTPSGVPLTPEEGQDLGAYAAPASYEFEGSIEELDAAKAAGKTFDGWTLAKPLKIESDVKVMEIGGKRALVNIMTGEGGKASYKVLSEDLGAEYSNDIRTIDSGNEIGIYAAKVDGDTLTYEKVKTIAKDPKGSAKSLGANKPVIVSTSEVDTFMKEDDLSGFNSNYDYLKRADATWSFDDADLDDYDPEQKAREISELHLTYNKNIQKIRGTGRDAIKYASQDRRDAQGYALSNAMTPGNIAKLLENQEGSADLDIRIFKQVDVDTLSEIILNLNKLDKKSPYIKDLESYRNSQLHSESIQF